jgi:hypothetical protein
VSVMKRLNLMRAQGQPIPKALLEFASPRPETAPDAAPAPVPADPPAPDDDAPAGRIIARETKAQGTLFE